MTKLHELKTWPEFFAPIQRGELTGCVRHNDRRFAVGDHVLLREWSRGSGYTGASLEKRITYVLSGLDGICPGYVCLSFGEP